MTSNPYPDGSKEAIRHEYHACRLGYDTALRQLMAKGMSPAQADRFLFCRV